MDSIIIFFGEVIDRFKKHQAGLKNLMLAVFCVFISYATYIFQRAGLN